MGDTDTTRWPGIRTAVELLSHHWPDWLPSRVEDLDNKRMVVAAPTTPTIPFLMPDPGDSVKVHWVSHRGICELSARVDLCKRAPVPVWVVTATSEPTLHQWRVAHSGSGSPSIW